MSNGLLWLPLALGPVAPSSPSGAPPPLHAGTCPVVPRVGPWIGYATGACPVSLRSGTGPVSL
eukprot:8559838-Lingulodinium_polyedra.AAC.1